MGEAFEFLPEESIIQQIAGVKAKGLGKGNLYLTNLRVNFERVSGLLRKRSESMTLLNLEDVTHVGSRKNRLIIETAESQFVFAIKDSEQWERTVEAAVRNLLMKRRVAETGEVGKEFCPQCGSQILDRDVYCPGCGRKIRFD